MVLFILKLELPFSQPKLWPFKVRHLQSDYYDIQLLDVFRDRQTMKSGRTAKSLLSKCIARNW